MFWRDWARNAYSAETLIEDADTVARPLGHGAADQPIDLRANDDPSVTNT
jgi:hypothetical protein